MKWQLPLYSTLCSFLLTVPVFAAESEPQKDDEKNHNVTIDEINETIDNEKTEDEPMDFPDEPYWPPAEGELELPWSKYVGYDEGFFIRNADNTFSLVFNGLLQARYLYSQADGLSDYHRFELRRTDLYFSGHFIDESWTYVLGTESGPDGVLALDDVYIAKAFTDNSWGQVGQFSTPFLRETLISSTRQLAVERSLVSKYFSTNNSTGINYGVENNLFKWQASATNGYFSHDPDENEDVVDHDFQNGLTYAFISRLEFKPLGDWAEFRGFSSFGENETGLLIGVAAAYQRDNDISDIEETSGTIDMTFQGSGWSTFGMVAATKDRINDENTSYGAQIQGGVFVDEEKDTLELMTRYEWGDSSENHEEDRPETFDQDLSILTAGVNWYIYPRHLKFSTDFGYAFSSIGENWSNQTDGWRATDESGQWVGRAQLQLVI